ncbi:MAG: dihydrofolate reductase [Saprospiraceae bacterium]|nr:dihydrofolate reductase [Saprospiraceae bacterium]MBK7810236.1 dihydrofolate reductase [Saprospiraceae bacterium]MBK9629839.1 dihydrofolate reductase [Saprospiraceae bacterium]
MIISSIVAMNKERIIGLGGQIPWYLPADLKYFKKVTLNHHVLMGRICFESIGKPLPKRTNIIASRDPYFIVSGCYTCPSIEEGIALAKKQGAEELFIIGGGVIYEHTQHLWNRVYLTLVDYQGEGDVFFPELNYQEYNLISEEHFEKDEKNEYTYSFQVFDRK